MSNAKLHYKYYDCEAFFENVIPYLESTKWENERAREVFLNVAEGVEYMIAMLFSRETGEKLGVIFSDIEKWIVDYSKIYLRESKEGELKEFIKVFYHLAQKYIK